MSEQLRGEAQAPSRNALWFLLFTINLNMAGVGLTAPVTPYLVAQYVSSPDQVAAANGWMFSSYAICSFLAIPVLGALSDRYGRKPVLMLCLLGTAAGYSLIAVGGALWVLLAGRVVDGITAGNLGAIYASLADLTTPKQRTRYYGLLGAAAALGFVIGPAIGGLAAALGGPTAPIWFGAAATLVNMFWGLVGMPETLARENRRGDIRITTFNPFGQLFEAVRLKGLTQLLLGSFAVTVAFAMMASNLSVLARELLNWKPAHISVLFVVIGLVGIMVQGLLLRPLLRVLGERRLGWVGPLVMALSFAMIASVPYTLEGRVLYLALAAFATGNGLFNPAFNGLVSQTVDATRQGQAQSAAQSTQAVGRALGPILASFLYVRLGPPAPYEVGVALFVGAALIMGSRR